MRVAQQIGDGERLVGESSMEPEQFGGPVVGEYLLESRLNVHTRGHRERAAGGNQPVELLLAEVALQGGFSKRQRRPLWCPLPYPLEAHGAFPSSSVPLSSAPASP